MTRTSRRLHRIASAVVGAAVTALVVSGCANPVPVPQPEAVAPVPPPVLDQKQSTAVLDQVGTVLAAADEARNREALAERLTGPALTVRQSEYTRAEATGGERTPVQVPTSAQVTITPDTTEWPRWQMVVTEQPADLQAPLLLVLVQESPREQYKLWSWSRLGQSVQMPATAEPDIGSEPVPADSDTLTVTPTDAIAQYADLLTNGSSSAHAGSFGEDFFSTAVWQSREQTIQSLQAVATVTETVTPADGQVMALRTTDGGAIVVGQMNTVTTATLSQGSITLNDPFDVALAGTDSVTGALVRTWTDVIALYVPPAGSQDQVQVLAAEHARTAVSVS